MKKIYFLMITILIFSIFSIGIVKATVNTCAKEGEAYSTIFTDKYPSKCCSGLKMWESGMDTRKIVDGKCVETGLVSGWPVGTCLKCGDGICDGKEDICNCPEDCGVSREDEGNVKTNPATQISERKATLNGKVEDSDLYDTWFAISKTDSTPSCSSSTQREDSNGKVDKGNSFYARMVTLNQNTRYYFRACGENRKGNIKSGSIKYFETKNYLNENAEYTTLSAENISDYCVTLRGSVIWNLQKPGVLHFSYGIGEDIDKYQEVWTVRFTDGLFNRKICGLTPNTKYYFKACSKTDKCEILNFKTTSNGKIVPTPIVPIEPPEVPTPIVPIGPPARHYGKCSSD